jgi:hypothetical protein
VLFFSLALMGGHIVSLAQTLDTDNASEGGVAHLRKSMAVALVPHGTPANTVRLCTMQADMFSCEGYASRLSLVNV